MDVSALELWLLVYLSLSFKLGAKYARVIAVRNLARP